MFASVFDFLSGRCVGLGLVFLDHFNCTGRRIRLPTSVETDHIWIHSGNSGWYYNKRIIGH